MDLYNMVLAATVVGMGVIFTVAWAKLAPYVNIMTVCLISQSAGDRAAVDREVDGALGRYLAARAAR